ncbi:MAG TPA: hypothetical protein VEL69_08375 [Ktedonobacteraceae bacterium]|nr:hypothetical protein [Ktedonobacteraceae bacterium]
MKTTVTHICNHQRILEAVGTRKAAQLRKWMASVKCPTCREAGK